MPAGVDRGAETFENQWKSLSGDRNGRPPNNETFGFSPPALNLH
jgi:hypothetical protein